MAKRAFQGRFDQEIIHGIRIHADTIDLNQAAGVYNLFTAINQDLWLEAFGIRLPNVDVSDDGSITSIAIATNDTTAVTILSSGDGATANLTAEKQFVWTTGCLLKSGKKVELTIAGGRIVARGIFDKGSGPKREVDYVERIVRGGQPGASVGNDWLQRRR